MAVEAMMFRLSLLLYCALGWLSLVLCKERIYKTEYIDVPLDHYSFAVNKTFKMRYLLNDSYWEPYNGPVLFYTGNEADVELYAKNIGLLWEMAPQLNALIVFAEHRYYGKSLPFGNESHSVQNVGYLTSSQAIADYVDLISLLLKGKNNAVISIGGSYGGMLAAYIRIKYPHIVTGAIASSAPILQFDVECGAFNRILTSAYNQANPNCVTNIKKSWAILKNITSSDKKWISETFKLCPFKKNETTVDYIVLRDWLTDIYTNLGMMNYPSESNYLAPLPGYPVATMCKYINDTSLSGKHLLEAISSAISVYTNFTGKTKCNKLDTDMGDVDADGWSYQACTEMAMPICSDGKNDMFEPVPWNNNEYSKDCKKKWNAEPVYRLAIKEYGGKRLQYASNIVFANGLLDPWAGGGVMKNLSRSVVAFIIPEGAHHLDLMDSTKKDPYSVTLVRKQYVKLIKRWVGEYYGGVGYLR